MKQEKEKEFGCSEMYVFGKFETFKKRVEEICNVLQNTVTYSILQSSTIEGIDVFAQKFQDFFKKISSQKYDALNHRLPYFDKDYSEYRQSVVDTEWELEEFVGISLSKLQDVDNVLRLLARKTDLVITIRYRPPRVPSIRRSEWELRNLRNILLLGHPYQHAKRVLAGSEEKGKGHLERAWERKPTHTPHAETRR
ncbi:hypothetical protein HHI36_018207 [Cryptolaemus montrouzieri]|uniref:Dynein heavy chain tail domain-containing protein n=1 Tax=Cryptolaemus montrouzieri TaxID=559131 RepID=A0ABD2P062_9CUCU